MHEAEVLLSEPQRKTIVSCHKHSSTRLPKISIPQTYLLTRSNISLFYFDFSKGMLRNFLVNSEVFRDFRDGFHTELNQIIYTAKKKKKSKKKTGYLIQLTGKYYLCANTIKSTSSFLNCVRWAKVLLTMRLGHKLSWQRCRSQEETDASWGWLKSRYVICAHVQDSCYDFKTLWLWYLMAGM